MSRSTTKPLPANLPKLPELPAGYDAWVYKKTGWLPRDLPNAPWAWFLPGYCNDWYKQPADRSPMGDRRTHYIVAVKRPAKASAAKKTKKPERKAGRVVAVRVDPDAHSIGVHATVSTRSKPAFVLPADAASVERAVEQGVSALSEIHSGSRSEAESFVRAALAAIGIAATGKGARK